MAHGDCGGVGRGASIDQTWDGSDPLQKVSCSVRKMKEGKKSKTTRDKLEPKMMGVVICISGGL